MAGARREVAMPQAASDWRTALRRWSEARSEPPRTAGLFAGPLLFALVLAAPAPAGLPPQAHLVAAVTVWMAAWWLTEALPLPATALLPLILFPILGVRTSAETAASYGNSVIFLFLGGLILAAGVERWALHQRLARAVIPRAGRSAGRALLACMGVTAFLSMWMSNTAAALVMLPVAGAIVDRRLVGDEATRPAVAATFMLGIAYAASLGGIGTLIGSPPNAVLAGYAAASLETSVGFLRWMAWGVPVAVVSVLVAWLYLRTTHGGLSAFVVGTDGAARGEPWTSGERRMVGVFAAVVALWLLRGSVAPLAATGLTDEAIAIGGAILLFAIPAGRLAGPRLLQWDDLHRIPWGVLVLFGGGLALAGGIEQSGLAAWLGARIALPAGWPAIAGLLAFVVFTILLTELASNTATAAVLLPIAHGAAVALGLDPIVVVVAISTAASCAFMLPIATPPNAVVFSSGRVTQAQMIRAGLALNVVMAVIVTLAAALWLQVVWALA